MAVNEELQDGRVPQRLRGRVTAYVNIGLCVIGAVFIVIGVLRSTLLLYVGCAFIGAAIGGFIRSRLPIHQMHMVPPHLHMVYRHELQRNIQAALQDGVQTFLVVNGQRTLGVDQKTIEKHSSLITYKPQFTASMRPSESVDRISVISSFTDNDEASCIICLVSFKKGQQLRQLKCQHLFHVDCIDKWLKINRLCPTCRVDLTGSSVEKQANNMHSNSPQSSRSVPMPTTANLDNENDNVVGSNSISIVINALEDITRNHEDLPDRAEDASESTEEPPSSSQSEAAIELNHHNEQPCTSSNDKHAFSTSRHDECPCASSSNDCDQADSDCDQDQYHSAEDLPSVSAVVDIKDREEAHESSSTSLSSPALAGTCGMEVKSTVITLSMPQNATPWV